MPQNGIGRPLMTFSESTPATEGLAHLQRIGAGGGNRTHTSLSSPRILSPVRLPVSPPRLSVTGQAYQQLAKTAPLWRVLCGSGVPARCPSSCFAQSSKRSQPRGFEASIARPCLPVCKPKYIRRSAVQLRDRPLITGAVPSLQFGQLIHTMAERPCPDCGKPGRVLDVGSHAVEYLRCSACGFVWTQDRDDPDAPPTAITRPPRVRRAPEQ